MNQTPCKAASDALQKRQFLDWNGLPESCEPSVLLDVPSKPMADLPQVLVGTDFRALKFQMIPWEGYHHVRACFEQGNLVLVDGQHPELTYPLADLLTSLGEPVAKLDWHHGTTPIAGGEWAYPGRGITLYLNTDRDRLLHVAVYQQTDLASYLTRLRLNLEAKRLPLRMPPPGRG